VDPARITPVVQAVQKVAPAVVAVTTEMARVDPFWGTTARSSSEGSGVVIDPKGVVLTNAHVVEQATRIQAGFADGRSFEAELVGIAPELDLAVLRLVGAEGLTAAPIGSSAGLLLGEPVIAIGNPFGLGHTVTTGVVSAIARPLETEARVYQDFIQTDASINPGNSGGPLLDATGALIGINTAIRPDAEGIGFAIPVDRAMKVAKDLVQFGQVQVPWLGIDLEDVVLRGPKGRVAGVRVSAVHADTPAAKMGIRTGDLVRAVGGRPSHARADINAWLAGQPPNGAVSLELDREGTPLRVEVLPGPLPEAVVDRAITTVLGVSLADGQRGVVITKMHPQGAMAAQKLRPGDTIVAINGEPTPDLKTFRQILGRTKSAHRNDALFTLRRGEAHGRFHLPI
jgi:S1-C subfamily serine protease